MAPDGYIEISDAEIVTTKAARRGQRTYVATRAWSVSREILLQISP